MGITYVQPLSYPSQVQGGNPSFEGTSAYYPYGGYTSQAPMSNNIPAPNGFMYPLAAPSNNYPSYTQPMYPLPNAPAYPNHGPTGLFVDSTVYVTPFVCWIEDYPLPDGLKMPSHVGSYDKKGDPDNYLHIFEGAIRMEKMGNARSLPYVHLYTDDTLQILGLHEEQRISEFVHGLKIRSLVEFLSTYLLTTYNGHMEKTYTWIEAKEVATNGASNDHRESFDRFTKNSSWENNKGKKNRDSPREILATEKAAKTFEQPPRMIGSRWSHDMSKYCYFHEDHRHDTNQCRELRRQEGHTPKRKTTKGPISGIREITFLPVSGVNNSSDPVIIKVQISRRQVNRVYIDSGSSCGVICEHCFLKLKPSIRALRVGSKVLIISFSESTLGLSKRTAKQKIGIVVSTIHKAIKFHTPRGIGTIFLAYEPNKIEEGQKKFKEACLEIMKGVLSCVEAEERIVVNDKYPDQTIVIEKQLPSSFKKKLRDLFRSNINVFAWIYADMMEILRTITVGGKPFNTEHKLNEYKHITPVKQKKHGLGPDRSEAACKEVEELMKAGILRRVKNQTCVANLVMVKKSDGGWRVCVDFTDINKAYPNDCYPLSKIDWKVESLSGFRLK
ncbi:hypothetical protein Tco_1226652 [Tanacetum coccineum]